MSRRRFDAYLPHNSTKKCRRSTKIFVGKVVHAKGTLQTSSKIKRSKVKVTRQIGDLVALQVTLAWGWGILWQPPAQLVNSVRSIANRKLLCNYAVAAVSYNGKRKYRNKQKT